MGNGEKPANFDREKDGSCLTGGAIRMDSESSGQGKRQADNHHVNRPPKKKTRSEDEAEDYEEDGETKEEDSDAESEEDEEDDSNSESEEESDAESEKYEEDDSDAESEDFPGKLTREELAGLPTYSNPYKLTREELAGLPTYSPPPKLTREKFLGNHLSLDGSHEVDMKCDSEGSNEMAGGWFPYVPRKTRWPRSSRPFVSGSVNFKDCDANVINCNELGKRNQFDADCIDVTHSHNLKSCTWGDKYLYELKHSLPAV